MGAIPSRWHATWGSKLPGLPFEFMGVILYNVSQVMLDPYVRVTLRPDVHGVFAADFKVPSVIQHVLMAGTKINTWQAPDVHGVYQLRVLYRRLGFSTITLSSQVLKP